MKALADVFAAAQQPSLEWEGETAYAVYEIVPAPEALVVRFLKAAAAPVQGLTLKATGASLVVNEVEASEIVLWRDTAPDEVIVRVRPAPGNSVRLKVWNVWRATMGGVEVTQAWLGNAGMRVEAVDPERRILLRCSDGQGPVDFTDLEVSLTLL